MITLILLPLAILFAIGATTPTKGKTIASMVGGLPPWRRYTILILTAPLTIWHGCQVCLWQAKKWWAWRQGRKAARRIIKKIGNYKGNDPEILDALENAKRILGK